MGYYDVDYDEMIWPNVPVPERDAFTNSWLKVLISPLKYVNTLFKAFRLNVLYFLAHNSQVCYMEAVLNDTFDPDQRRIFISDGPYKDAAPVFLEAENKPLVVFTEAENNPLIVYTDAETVTDGVQFVVNIKTDITTQSGYSLARVKASVNKYRLPSKSNYLIVIY